MSRYARGQRSAMFITVGLLAILTSLLTSWPARAHDKKEAGDFHLVIGWGDEPAFSGSKNAIEVDVADKAGHPVADPQAALSVEVSFGNEHVVLPLRPARGVPGKFRALLLPTRPGTYAFHITGTLKGQAIDTTSTCSEQTFACVVDVSELQFPVKDPSTGQIADRISREVSRGEVAIETAAGARKLGIGSLAVALLALVAAIAAIGRGRRNGRTGA